MAATDAASPTGSMGVADTPTSSPTPIRPAAAPSRAMRRSRSRSSTSDSSIMTTGLSAMTVAAIELGSRAPAR